MDEIKRTEKKKKSPVPPLGKLETQWVTVFNVITGKGKSETKRTYKLDKNPVVIGSALSSDIRIQQNSVSNVHAIVETDAQGATRIYDMASETGVFLNGEKVVSAEVKSGDEIKIGFAVITLKRQSLAEAQAQLPKPLVKSSGGRKLFLNDQEDFRPLILEDERDVIPIFKYPKGSELALQAVLYWDDVILDIKHFSRDEPVSLGEGKSANFLVPGLMPDYQILAYENGSHVLQFSGDMEGVIRSGKQLVSLADLRTQQRGGNRIALKLGDEAKIQYRGMTLFLSYSPFPPVLRRQRILDRDPFYTRIWFSSLLLTTALILLMGRMEKPSPLAVEELPPRIATIIFQPPPPKVVEQKLKPKKAPEQKVVEHKPKVRPPTTKPVQKAETKHAKKLPSTVKHLPSPPHPPVNIAKAPARSGGGARGEGSRGAGKEGPAGKSTVKTPTTTHGAMARGQPKPQGTQKAPVSGEGNVESFFNGIDGTITKKLAAGSAGAKAAGENLRGHSGFTTGGNGGLGELGNGTGGGGKSMSVSGLGTKGLGDGSAGSSLGRIGTGGDLSGLGHGRPSVEIGNVQDTVIMGGLDKDLVDRIIKQHMDQIRHCYELEANGTKSDLRGRVMVRFLVASSGRVSQSGVQSSSLRNANVERCLVNTIQRIIFPEPQGGGVVEVAYPFLFAPTFSSRD